MGYSFGSVRDIWRSPFSALEWIWLESFQGRHLNRYRIRRNQKTWESARASWSEPKNAPAWFVRGLAQSELNRVFMG